MSFRKLLSSSVCTAVLCSVVSAQESKPNQVIVPQQANVNQGTGKTTSNPMVSQQQLATCWALDNHEAVILAKFAQDKTENKEVAAFARMLADEHQGCLKKLSKFAPDAVGAGYLKDDHSERTNTRSDSNARANGASDKSNEGNQKRGTNQTAATSTTAAPAIDMMQLHREIAQQCVTDSQKYLSSKQDNEFDKCFVGMQIAKHAAMHTKLVVMQRHTTNEMQQMVEEGIQATAKHMKAAETLMATLESTDSEKSSE